MTTQTRRPQRGASKRDDRTRITTMSETRTRQTIRTADWRDWRKSRTEFLRQWDAAPDAILAEHTWQCPYCGCPVEPRIFDGPDGPIVRRRDRCGCDKETLDLEHKASVAYEAHRQFEAEQYGRRLARAGLVGWLTGATFDAYRTTGNGPHAATYKERVETYCKAVLSETLTYPWLLLYGAYGTGKTHLAARSEEQHV